MAERPPSKQRKPKRRVTERHPPKPMANARPRKTPKTPKRRQPGESAPAEPPENAGSRWLTVRDAAIVLSVPPENLRRAFERHSRRVADGGTEAEIDGVRARKFGRQWRVRLGNAWQI